MNSRKKRFQKLWQKRNEGKIAMARWCLRNDHALNDDERWNIGCTDEWGTHHSCEGCPHNRYMGDGKPITATFKDYTLC